ncbi:MAG: hypothetical protein MJ070_01995 [Lachnospiraceae bacterium]|nr:hypothetical protein [Lachnospiraceae bacterium]
MKKTLLAGLLLLAMLCTLFSCREAGKNPGETNGESEETLPTDETTPGAVLVAEGSRSAMRLDGEWRVKGDEKGEGIDAGWFRIYPSEGKILSVPGSQTDAEESTANAWFFTRFKPDLEVNGDDRVYLQLGGVCYQSTVFLNGIEVGGHTGAYGFFTIDVTDAIKYDRPNILAVYARTGKASSPIKGLTTDNLPVWNAVPAIGQAAYLYAKPQVSIADTTVVPSCEDGTVALTVTLRNASDAETQVSLGASVRENGNSLVIDCEKTTVTVPVGESSHRISLEVKNFRYWSPDSPELYQVSVTTLENGKTNGDEYLVKTGFKTLKVDEKGYFELNGERIYIKCAHTSSHIPGSVDTAKDLSGYYELLTYLKSCGFNTVRFLQSPAQPQVLQFCDEIGLMVYEEHPMSWKKTDCDRSAELFDLSVKDVLLRDRNHVSLAIFGMLNETEVSGNKTKIYQQAVKEIKTIRAEAPNLLFLFSSGRWDGDKSVGSASNPGSTAWDAFMGNESASAVSGTSAVSATPVGMGDVHYYPSIPYGETARKTFADYADTERAVFFSEAGAGSQVNVISEYLYHRQSGIPDYGLDIGTTQRQTEDLRVFFDEYGLDRVWATPEEMIEATEVYQASQRALLLTMIRRLGSVSGHSMTMANDVGFRGEGILETSGSVKNAMTETLQEALDDLRFCITVANPNSYAGDGVKLEIVLSNLGVLKEETYRVRVRITGENGTAFDQTVEVKPGKTDVIVPVLNETVPTADWKSGTYKVSAEMLNGAHATCGTETFCITNRKDLPSPKGTVYLYNVSSAVRDILTKNGASVVNYTPGDDIGSSTLFVGGEKQTDAGILDQIWEAARNGAHVAVVDYRAIGVAGGVPDVPFAKQGVLSETKNWLYHFDAVVLKTALTEGLQSACIMDTQYYADVWSDVYFAAMATPNDIAVANFFAGNDENLGKAFEGGYQLGTFRYGSGYLTLSTLKLSGDTPAAARILLNIASYHASESYTGGEYNVDDSPKKIILPQAKTIRIDGKVSAGEWGEPVLKGLNYEKTQESDYDQIFFDGDPNADRYAESDLYYAYDSKYFYAAAVVRDVDRDTTAEDDGSLEKHAGFGVMFAAYAPGTTIPRITYQGDVYEQYVHINYYLLGDGSVKAQIANEGVDWIEQVSYDFDAVYDEATRTMTYEVRIPLSQSNVRDPRPEMLIATSAYIRLPYTDDKEGNLYRYGAAINLPRGAGKTPMMDGSVLMTLG